MPGRPVRLAIVLFAAGLTAGCWQPLYRTTPNADGVQDKFAAIDIPPIPVPKGTPVERVAVALRNALQYDLHNGENAFAPTYQLKVVVSASQFTAYLDPTTGRPNTQISSVNASFQLIELATGKTAVSDSTFAHVDYDIPGSQQRFAGQRAHRDAEGHAVQVVAEAITGWRRISSPALSA
jgi:LPS-assembly lipoprotein